MSTETLPVPVACAGSMQYYINRSTIISEWKGPVIRKMKRALKYLLFYKKRLISGYTVKILGTVVELFIPWIMAKILDEVVPYVKLEKDYMPLFLWGSLMVILALLARFMNMFANRRAAWTSKEAIKTLRDDLFEKIMGLSGKQTDGFGIPSLVSRLTGDVHNIHSFFNIIQRIGVRAPLIIAGGLVISATLDPVLTLTLVATLPFVFIIVFTISKKGVPLYTRVQSSVDEMVRVIREDISGIRVIKALSKENYEKSRFEGTNNETVKNELNAAAVMAASGPFIGLSLNFGLVLVIIVGAFRIHQGSTLPGVIVAFLTYFTMILNAVITVNRIFVDYSKASASAGRVWEVMDSKNDLEVIEPAGDKKTSDHMIEFRNVSFTYADTEDISEEKLVLKDISFTLDKNESLGIIGATGSGKTTILNLLMRYYDTTCGDIFVDGKNVKEYGTHELRSKFGTAFQNNVIFADTIKENISFGREISEETIENAARAAEAYDFILSKEGGFDHEASIKGSDFSGGQKQRLFIARALAGKPEILILDDSSSALDYKTDAMVRKAIASEYSDRVVISVAQRISSIMKMDKIIVLDDGKMIGYGKHEELMENCDVYREIAKSQLGSLI